MKNVEMMNDFQSLKRKYMAREAGSGRPLLTQTMPTIQEEDGGVEELLKKTLKNMKNALDGAGDGSSHENLVKEYHPSRDKVETRSLEEPPGIRAEPWEVPLPVSDDDGDGDGDDDGDDAKFDADDQDGDKVLHPAAKAIKDHWKLYPGPLSYGDTEDEREYKLAWSEHLRNLPEPPIDEKDTMPGMLTYDDTEEERRKKHNYRKKYPRRFTLNPPKYTFP